MLNRVFSIYFIILNFFRINFLRLRGAKIANRVKIFGRVTVVSAHNLTIGAGSTLNEGVHFNCREKVVVGEGVRISTYVQIHSAKLLIDTCNRIHSSSPVTIQNNVWIAAGTVVSAGVVIGENSIVGANSVVIKSLGENGLYAGNPAVKIRDLT